MKQDYFGAKIAENYDSGDAVEYTGETIAATVDVLADLAGSGGLSSSPSAPAASRCR